MEDALPFAERPRNQKKSDRGPSVDIDHEKIRAGIQAIREKNQDGMNAFAEYITPLARACIKKFARYATPQLQEDIFQNVLLIVFQKIGQLENVESFGPWLHKIAQNATNKQIKTNDILRNHKRVESIDNEILEKLSVTPTVANVLEREEIITHVHQAIAELPEMHQEILRVNMEEKTHEEIAQELNINIGTVKSRLYRARELLREKLQRTSLADSMGI